MCLAGTLNINECGKGSDNCWREGRAGGASACVDTFRGFICRCGCIGWKMTARIFCRDDTLSYIPYLQSFAIVHAAHAHAALALC